MWDTPNPNNPQHFPSSCENEAVELDPISVQVYIKANMVKRGES